MNKKVLFSLSSILLITLLFTGIAQALFSDLVYMVGNEQASRLAAQNPEAQTALDMYNVMKSGNYMGLAQSQLCKEQGASEMCNMMSTFQQYSSYTEILNNPTSYFQQMMQQQACKDNPAACNAYSTAMQAQAKASKPIETAKAYATQMATQQMQGVLPKRVSTIISYKRYLDAWQMQPQKKDKNKVTGNIVANTEIKSSVVDRESCMAAFNFDGTYGNIYNCVTGIPETREGWQGHDLSPVLDLEPGTLLLGTQCALSRVDIGLVITTASESKDSPCFIRYQGKLFENFVSGEVEKGPDGEPIQSATFSFDEQGNLAHAEFMVSEETEYVIGDKKYRLQEGTTVIIENDELRLGFDNVKDLKVGLFDLTDEGWQQAATVVPAGLSQVKVKSLEDGRYLISGDYKIQGQLDDFVVGQDSNAEYRAVKVKTNSQQVRFTRCNGLESENHVDFCSEELITRYQAQGQDFTFCEQPGRCYDLETGKVQSEVEEKYGQLVRKAEIEGNVGLMHASCSYMKQDGRDLLLDVDQSIRKSGVADINEVSENVRQLGSMITETQSGREGESEGMLEGVTEDCSDVDKEFISFKDALVEISAEPEESCLSPSEEPSRLTGKAIADITGRVSDELRQQIMQDNEACEGVNIKSKTSPPSVVVEVRGFFSKDLYVNDQEVSTMFYDGDKEMIGLRVGARTYFADIKGERLFKPKVVGVESTLEHVSILTPDVVEYIEEEFEDNEEYLAAQRTQELGTAEILQSGELVQGRVYITNTLDNSVIIEDKWRFMKRSGTKWGNCQPLEREPCPSSVTGHWILCEQPDGMRYLLPLEEASGFESCPGESKRIKN